MNAELEEGWEIYPTPISLSSDEVYRDHLLDHGPYMTEEGTYVLLFEVDSEKAQTADFNQYNVDIYIAKGEENIHQLFYLK